MQYFLPLLGLLFIGLKLANVITWSWWLVLAPIYIPFIIGVGIVGVAAWVALKQP